MRAFNSAFSLQPSALACWLPDMDLNHDKQIQSLLCYRYTIGQAGALDRLEGFPSQSSWQTEMRRGGMSMIDVRPHPSLLPRGEGETARADLNFARQHCRHRLSAVRHRPHTTTRVVRIVNDRRIVLPLL